MRFVKVVLLLLVAAPAWGQNLIMNSSFEYWLFGSPVGWLTSNSVAESSVVQDTNANTGTYCALLAGSDTSAFVITTTIVRAGYSYAFSGFCRVPGILPSSFILQFTTLLAGPIGNPTIIPVIYSGSRYREYDRWITAPDSSVFLLVTFATLPHATAYLDDVTLDDTTLTGITEPGSAPSVPPQPMVRKLVVPASSVLFPPAGSAVYDLLGRNVSGCLRPGIYFVVEER
jgi:hypothetical protein